MISYPKRSVNVHNKYTSITKMAEVQNYFSPKSLMRLGLLVLHKRERFLNNAVSWTFIITRSDTKMIKKTSPNRQPPRIPIPWDDIRMSVALSFFRTLEDRFRTGTDPWLWTFWSTGFMMFCISSIEKSFRNSHLLTLGSSLSAI